MKKLAIKRGVVGLVIISSMAIPILTFAETTTSTTAQVDVIIQLQKQIQALLEQIKTLQQQKQTAVTTLITTLKQGSSGDAVKTLQALLAADPSIYPEARITGFFGSLTARAVQRFQAKHGLEQVGNVGPRTLEKLKKLLEDNPLDQEDSDEPGEGKRPCAIVPPGHLIAPGWLKKHEGERPVVPTCQKLPHGIEVKLGSTTPTTTPDVLAPVIANIVPTNLGTSSVTINWLTNEKASGKVYYGSVSPLNLGTAPSVNHSSLMQVHGLALTGLTPTTTYYFVIESKDAVGNTATSSQQQFTTPALPDTIAPVISSVSIGSIGSTSAIVSWSTNETANSKVYYGTASPLNLGTAVALSDASLVTGHNLTLTSLTASTTYYAVVESTDASSNKATSTQQAFLTLP